jgi:hypothetical protein
VLGEGWRIQAQVAAHFEMDPPPQATAPPTVVTAVPRLAQDLSSLLSLMSSEEPPQRVVRSKSLMVAIYGFGDASGAGFGSTILGPDGIHYRHGIWGSDLSGKPELCRVATCLVLYPFTCPHRSALWRCRRGTNLGSPLL